MGPISSAKRYIITKKACSTPTSVKATCRNILNIVLSSALGLNALETRYSPHDNIKMMSVRELHPGRKGKCPKSNVPYSPKFKSGVSWAQETFSSCAGSSQLVDSTHHIRSQPCSELPLFLLLATLIWLGRFMGASLSVVSASNMCNLLFLK